MAETIQSRRSSLQYGQSKTSLNGIEHHSLKSSDILPLRQTASVTKVNIEFNSKRKLSGRGETVDISDVVYEITSFLDQHICLFTHGLTYRNENLKVYLDLVSMECSVIPGRCRGPYYNLLGYFSSALDRYDRADKYFEMALKINPEDTVASVNKARNYLKTGDIAKIQPLIRRLKEIRSRTAHTPGCLPLSVAHNTIALAYNKLGLSCAALRHYNLALGVDSLNCDAYLGKGEVLVRMSKHQGRANALKTLNEGISCIRKYVAEYNVLNLARETDPRESPLPRDNKAVNNVFAVVLLARALNEKSRRLHKEYSTEAIEYMDLALSHATGCVMTLYQVGDEKRLMGELEGNEGALHLLKQAIDMRDSSALYHSYALTILKWEQLKYEERFRAASHMTTSTTFVPEDISDGNQTEQDRKKSVKHSSKGAKTQVFVFEGDDELKEGLIRVAKLLKHALKLAHNESTTISLDLAEIYCSLNRKSEAEAMFNNVLESVNPMEREWAYRKFGRFLIKIGDFQRGDEMMEEAIKLRNQVNHDESSLTQLEETLTVLADHFKTENAAREKFWHDQLCQINPNIVEEHNSRGQKSSRAKGR